MSNFQAKQATSSHKEDSGCIDGATKEIRCEAMRVYESALCSSEAQFAMCKKWRSVDRWLGISSTVLAAIAGVSGLASAVSAPVAGLVAAVAAGLGAISTSIGPSKIAERSSAAANSYRNLQQDTRIFINIDLNKLELNEARDHLQSIVERQQELNKSATVPSERAWLAAKKNCERGGQEYAVDRGEE